MYTPGAEDMKETFKEVIKIYIPPRTSVDKKSDRGTDTDTDTYTTGITLLEDEKEAAQRQKGQGLKILTPK